MGTQTSGIHHVTTIAVDWRRNVDFYAGTPGSLMTSFPWPGASAGESA